MRLRFFSQSLKQLDQQFFQGVPFHMTKPNSSEAVSVLLTKRYRLASEVVNLWQNNEQFFDVKQY